MISNYQTKEAVMARLMDSPIFAAEVERAMLHDSVTAIRHYADEAFKAFKEKRQARQRELDLAAKQAADALSRAKTAYEQANAASARTGDQATLHRQGTAHLSRECSELATARASRLEELGIRSVSDLDARLSALGVK